MEISRFLFSLRSRAQLRRIRQEAEGYQRARELIERWGVEKTLREMEWQFAMGLPQTPFDMGMLRAISDFHQREVSASIESKSAVDLRKSACV